MSAEGLLDDPAIFEAAAAAAAASSAARATKAAKAGAAPPQAPPGDAAGGGTEVSKGGRKPARGSSLTPNPYPQLQPQPLTSTLLLTPNTPGEQGGA